LREEERERLRSEREVTKGRIEGKKEREKRKRKGEKGRRERERLWWLERGKKVDKVTRKKKGRQKAAVFFIWLTDRESRKKNG